MIRERIREHCGQNCHILTIKRSPTFGSSLFVVDFMRRSRLVRMLGSIDRTGRIMEQSAMDLLRPERLAFAYERLMMVAFTLVAEPRSALLLGLGGGAMVRHLAAYLPECALTVVERDPVVRDLARRHFHVTRPVVMADAEEFIAEAEHAYDVVMVDLYDAGGAARTDGRFWQDCVAALRPGGCLAVNWADFVGVKRVRGELREIAAVARRSFFLSEHGSRPNIIQLAPSLRGFKLGDLTARLKHFAEAHRLPRGNREVLRRCDVLTRYPVIELD